MNEDEQTHHRLIFGDSEDMRELEDSSIHLVVTSPPYFNAPFDYPDMFENYERYLAKMRVIAKEVNRVIAQGRIVCIVCDDMLVKGRKYPVVADLTKIYLEEGFHYRDRITWVKPEGYVRISRRSGVLLQHPYPMYFYPDNIQESILIFQKGQFNYDSARAKMRVTSALDIQEYQKNKWYLSTWNVVNVLPNKNRVEEGVAAFPEEIPYRLIKLFSYVGETILDPFMGSATTNKVAVLLGRNSVGYEIDAELVEIVKRKMGISEPPLFSEKCSIEIVVREDVRHLRRNLQDKVKCNRSVVRNGKGISKASR